MQRYFAKSKKDNQFLLEEKDYHHIKNVMRYHIGDNIEVIYDNKLYICNIKNITPLMLETIECIDQNNELNIDITIAISLVNEQKLDIILQKITELGVSNIIPIKTERSIIKLDDKKMTNKLIRWQTICKEASEQSKRTKIPKGHNVMSLKELTNIDNKLKLLCSTSNGTKPINDYLTDNIKEILFVIGPEGGFSETEEEFLLTKGFLPVSLGKRILRVETAAIYVASIINFRYEG